MTILEVKIQIHKIKTNKKKSSLHDFSYQFQSCVIFAFNVMKNVQVLEKIFQFKTKNTTDGHIK